MTSLLFAAAIALNATTAQAEDKCDGYLWMAEDIGIIRMDLAAPDHLSCYVDPKSGAGKRVFRTCHLNLEISPSNPRCLVEGIFVVDPNGNRILVTAKSVIDARDTTKDCFKVDDENSPEVTVSGRVTQEHRKLPKNSELRAAKGFYLKLDTPIRANAGAGCADWDEIAVMEFDNQNTTRLVKWNNRDVIVLGKLARFGSALVHPPIFIEISRMIDRRTLTK